MMGSPLISVLLTAASVAAFFGQSAVFGVLALVIPAVMIVLGVEYLLALLLSIYRPRQTGEPVRPAFDSRILGWLSSPESIGRIISETLNYQFGFEISRSWFYQLLARAVTPLIVVAAVVLIALSSVVIVPPQKQAIITTFGAMAGEPAGPGLHWKWPWPIGGAEKYDTARVKTLEVGSTHHGSHGDFLWSDQGGRPDDDFLITAPPTVEGASGLVSAIGELVGARMSVKYKIGDLKRYATGAAEPEQVLQRLADREMNAYFARHTIDTMLGGGRAEAATTIERRLQQALAARELGLTISDVTILHVHPPQGKGVVEAFHEKVAAMQQRQTRIQEARREAVQILASVAGSRQQAMAISEAKGKLDQLQQQRRALERQRGLTPGGEAAPDQSTAATQPADKLAQLTDRIEQQKLHVERLIQNAGGEAARILAEARAYRWTEPLAAQGKARRFGAQLAAFEQAPRYYRMRQYLDVLARTLREPRKFIMTAEAKVPPTIRLNLESAGSAIEELMGESQQ
jgi:regulator of protease activity HflC (stomatin/prohibitin superfamily)